MTTAAIIQARMGASRLPGKMALSIKGETIIEAVLARAAKFSSCLIYMSLLQEVGATISLLISLPLLVSMYTEGATAMC